MTTISPSSSRIEMIESTAVDWTAALVVAVTACLLLFTKVPPMLILGGDAAIGAIGLIG
jgi:hypothetical protein